MKCMECNVIVKNTRALVNHLRYNHKNISVRLYYNKYVKADDKESFCKTCGKQTNFISINKGYHIFCSTKCSCNSSIVKNKMKNTFKNKYGVENPFQNEEVKKKIRETCKEKYGVVNPSQSNIVKNKKINTSIKKYGVNHYLASQEAINKRKEIFKNKYGVDNPSKIDWIKELKKNTCLKNYGVDNPSQSDSIKELKKNTCLKNYGVDNPSKSDWIKELKKNTCLNKYGVDYVFKDKGIKQKIRETCKAKYGVENPNKNNEIKDKARNTYFINRIPDIIKMLEYNNIMLVGNYTNCQGKVLLKCLVCSKEFKSSYFNIQRGCGRCPKCFPRYKSIAEQEILNFVKNLGLEVVENSREIIGPYEIDIYLPSKKVAIEYNGLYWHSEIYGKDKHYHLNKLSKCLEKDIRLIQIFEDEWVYTQDIVKNRLKQILDVNMLEVSNKQRIHARKCKIEEIDSKPKNEFLDKYHIQGKDNSNIKLGAFYDNELVSVMTFSKGNIAKGNRSLDGIWELNRFCSNYDYRIPGIASKLLTYFKRNYDWEHIFSYADRRWSNGNLYYKLGFILEKSTQPNYWYVKGIKRIHRFGLRKRAEEPKDVPEWLLRLNEGYSRIWDCGHLKFIIKNN